MGNQIGFRKKRSPLANILGFLLFLIIVVGGYFWISGEYAVAPVFVNDTQDADSSSDRGSLREKSDVTTDVNRQSETNDESIMIDKVLPSPAGVDKSDADNDSTENDAVVERVFSDTINITEPEIGASLTSPFIVKGNVRISESTVGIRVLNKKEDILIDEVARVYPSSSDMGVFQIKLYYKFISTKEGFVEVYTMSPSDEGGENVARVPVKFN